MADIFEIFPSQKSLRQQAVAEAGITSILIAYSQEIIAVVGKHATYLIYSPVGVCRQQ